jgi:hypothetical protein
MALTFSRKLLRPLEGTDIESALNSALNKVASALPPQAHEYVRALDNLFSIGLGPHKNYQQYKTTVDLITQAIVVLKESRAVGERNSARQPGNGFHEGRAAKDAGSVRQTTRDDRAKRMQAREMTRGKSEAE